MTMLCPRLVTYLDENRVPYQTLHHSSDFTSQETAAHTRTPGREFAKTIALRIDDGYAVGVLPAHHHVDFEKLRRWTNAREIRLATEDEMRSLFPDCEVGAQPPFGNLYGVPVYVSAALAGDEHVTFNGGSHEDVIRMRYDDFASLVKPRVINFSTPP